MKREKRNRENLIERVKESDFTDGETSIKFAAEESAKVYSTKESRMKDLLMYPDFTVKKLLLQDGKSLPKWREPLEDSHRNPCLPVHLDSYKIVGVSGLLDVDFSNILKDV